MEYEIELKLLIQGEAGPIIESQLLPRLHGKISQQQVELSNSYFDTAKRDFRRSGMGLRIRGKQQQFEQTIKTSGTGISGLQQRPEYNVDLGGLHSAPDKPDLALFPTAVWPLGFDVNAAQASLFCQFSTHFTRNIYLIELARQTQVELVWDRGEIVTQSLCEHINEIELELKSGDISALFWLAKQLVQLMPASIGLLSKAARGYRLMDGVTSQTKNNPVAFTPLYDQEIAQANEAELASMLSNCLKQWQQLSARLAHESETQGFVLLKSNLHNLQAIVRQWTELNPQPSLVALSQELQWYCQSWANLQANQGLDADFNAQFERLCGSDAVVLQLDIMAWLTVGYQPTK